MDRTPTRRAPFFVLALLIAPASALAQDAASAAPSEPAAAPAQTAAPAASAPTAATPAQAATTVQVAAEAEPSPAALKFGKTCGGCHSLGDGDKAGPDLLGVLQRRDPAWVRGFIRTPGSYIDRGDKIANDLLVKFKGVRMPDQGLTDAELDDLFGYLRDCTQQGGCKLALGKVRPATEATPADIALGRQLFEGELSLSAGGPACLSCHHVRGTALLGGGTLAKDLTFVYARMGDGALDAALGSTPFPLMKDVFARHALTQAEIFAVKAYLWDVSRDGTQPRPDRNFLYAGALGAALALGLIGMVWAGRMTGRTRKDVINTKRGRA